MWKPEVKMEVTKEREIVIRLTKQDAARFKAEMDDLDAGFLVPGGSPFKQIHEKIVSALYQSMREENWEGPVE